MIDRDHKLSIRRQAKLLDISRGTVYYKPKPISPENQKLMNRIDRLHLELPFAGARMLRDLLRLESLPNYPRRIRSVTGSYLVVFGCIQSRLAAGLGEAGRSAILRMGLVARPRTACFAALRICR